MTMMIWLRTSTQRHRLRPKQQQQRLPQCREGASRPRWPACLPPPRLPAGRLRRQGGQQALIARRGFHHAHLAEETGPEADHALPSTCILRLLAPRRQRFFALLRRPRKLVASAPQCRRPLSLIWRMRAAWLACTASRLAHASHGQGGAPQAAAPPHDVIATQALGAHCPCPLVGCVLGHPPAQGVAATAPHHRHRATCDLAQPARRAAIATAGAAAFVIAHASSTRRGRRRSTSAPL